MALDEYRFDLVIVRILIDTILSKPLIADEAT